MAGAGEGSRNGEADSRRMAEIIAEEIERDIIERGWPVGTILGSEGDMIGRYGVSRGTLREAVRIVEHHSVARMRKGPGGGLAVTEPDRRAIESAAGLYLRYVGVRRQDLFQARAALELACVTAVAESITEDGIAALREVLRNEEQLGDEMLASHPHALHAVIARLTGNPALELFVNVLAQLDHELAHVHGGKWAVDPAQAFPDSHRAHEAIVDAIASGDAALAQHRMRRHLQAIAELLAPPSDAP
jgi:DNA-binding FadR family transcriptional regulator